MKAIILFVVLFLLFSCGGSSTYTVKTDKKTPIDMDNNIYKFTINSIDGSPLPFANFKGKKILIVNVASKCGYTKQYEDLQALSEKYKDKLIVIGFPSNDFMSQEPGTAEEIASFCKRNYGVTFPLAAKIKVKGNDAEPIYKWLCNKTENGVLDAEITWNFNKFLIDENGFIMAKYDSGVKPFDEAILTRL